MSKNLDELVIREVATDVWIFSKPFTRARFIPFGGRSTAIKLTNGDVWVLASTPLTQDTKETINKLGPVKWIVAGDAEHHLFLAEYKKAYADAKLVVVERLFKKKKDEGLDVTGAYGIDPPETEYGFESEIKAHYFPGFQNQDVAFYHVASKSLIVADLIFNLPGTEQYSKSKSSSKVPIVGKISPPGLVLKSLLWSLGKDKEAMRRDIKVVSEWDFSRIIMCHGDVIEDDAPKAWKDAYAKYNTK
ncbi:hypothetical protein EDD18DRAFT_1359028 [Armillaria luteobubalina]|uniref:Uncharacterized protein n=1 Tax=Armillaria luteobubalina TaxID=153913 RepID=A0AA39UCC5_9AGAR|nr:hypothetical protein EDD18DRAFT_361871 [Armillaria luteobubalina]KAK0490041.1 hypothetical protein EDD18DRAFT_1359028 [Armillaria luteobubalina]